MMDQVAPKRKPRTERKAACSQCRQQKLKCDLHQDPSNPCSRCKKLKLTCAWKPGFQRINVRRTKNLATRQLEEDCQKTQQLDDCNITPPVGIYFDSTTILPNLPPVQSLCTKISNERILDHSQSRSLSELHLDGKTITECYQSFFSTYAPLLTIFGSIISPDDCYERSLTLFWSIVVVGSRSLSSDPTLVHALAPEVVTLALTSFQHRRKHIDDIRGLLILCTWPCPSSTILKENTVALSGLLLSLSLQAGLHFPATQFGKCQSGDSVSRTELVNLWVSVVICYQGVMSLGGYPSMVFFGSVACRSFEKKSWHLLEDNLKFRYKIQQIIAESETIAVEFDFESELQPHQSLLSVRIKEFEAKVGLLECEYVGIKDLPLENLYLKLGRLQLKGLSLYCMTESNSIDIEQLLWAAARFITSVQAFSDTKGTFLYIPGYLANGVSLASFTLLRILKSNLFGTLQPSSIEAGKSSLFMAIRLLQQISLINNDIYAKNSEFLSTMWTNKTIFGSRDNTGLRFRNRFSMGVVFDSVIRWIERYGCSHVASSPLHLNGAKGSTESPESDLRLIFPGDDSWLQELDWSASLDSLMAHPIEMNVFGVNEIDSMPI